MKTPSTSTVSCHSFVTIRERKTTMVMPEPQPRLILPGDPDFTTETPAPLLRSHTETSDDTDTFDTFAGLGVGGLR
jgi:hypothetical protein